MVELLSPVGDFECLKAAVQNGANAVYFGSGKFNARQNATNFDLDSLEKAVQYAKLRNVKINFALNTLIKDDEFEDAINLVKKVYELGVDAIIVQDIGLAKYIIDNFPGMDVHASTQMTIHNLEGVLMLESLGFKRVVLSRELSLHEIEYICKNSSIEIECFVHGALCICYSGQCLLSSSIGGRSGNRGKCAQPCRLPYKLYEENTQNEKTYKDIKLVNSKENEFIIDESMNLDRGYLLSTRDLCSLEFLPSLIKAGITSFKIEGRMKTPEYVATCTKIYRKYIDLALSGSQYKIDDSDIKLLMQVFNRGSFSTGNFIEEPNKEYVFKEKPNNMGLYIGNVSKINSNKGLITLKTNEKLEVGDKISFQKEEHKYTISELMKNGENIPIANVNDFVTIGRMKGNIHLGDKIYKLSSNTYSKEISEQYNKENVKIPLVAYIKIKKGQNIALEVTSKDQSSGIYFSMSAKSEIPIVPIDAISSPITKERIKEQLSKTTDTPFMFQDIVFDMDENVYIPKISAINELRRETLESLQKQAIQRFSRVISNDNPHNNVNSFNVNFSNNANTPNVSNISNQNDSIKTVILDNSLSSKANAGANINAHYVTNTSKISLLIENLNLKNDYTRLNFNMLKCIYIPFKYFRDKQYEEILLYLSAKTKLYIYLPHILKDNFRNVFFNNFDNIISKYKIFGLVMSNISCLHFFSKYIGKLDIVANYTYNIFNKYTIDELKSLGVNRVTLSPELDEFSLKILNNVSNFNSEIQSEMMVYGKLRLMTIGYCLLGSSNMCYPNCKMLCRKENSHFFLVDRLNMKFRIIPDNVQTINAIYNSRITSINYKNINPNYVRVSVIDETISEINKILEHVKNDIVFEGENYTKGNFNKFV